MSSFLSLYDQHLFSMDIFLAHIIQHGVQQQHVVIQPRTPLTPGIPVSAAIQVQFFFFLLLKISNPFNSSYFLPVETLSLVLLSKPKQISVTF